MVVLTIAIAAPMLATDAIGTLALGQGTPAPPGTAHVCVANGDNNSATAYGEGDTGKRGPRCHHPGSEPGYCGSRGSLGRDRQRRRHRRGPVRRQLNQ
jgi:hypothetical protein